MRYFLTPQWDIYRSLSGLVTGQKVLEIGFGTGAGTIQLASHAEYVAAIELEREAVRFAEMVFPLSNIHWLEGDVTRLPETFGRYDAAVMIEVLEHVGDYQRALSNVYRVLKPGGRLYLSARNANADLRRNDLHAREWTARELVDSLEEVFAPVMLYDYTLTTILPDTTRVTPLVAAAWKGQ